MHPASGTRGEGGGDGGGGTPPNFMGRNPMEDDENMGPRPSKSSGTLCGMLISSHALYGYLPHRPLTLHSQWTAVLWTVRSGSLH